MLESVKQAVYEANLSLQTYGLITLTWGNVSQIDRTSGCVVIKPSGVRYEDMRPDQMVVTDLEGKVLEGKLRPSSDLKTHLELYKRFPDIGGVTHTHSRWATIFSQMGRAVPPLGTTHADAFYGPVPCTRRLTAAEIAGDYEQNTGLVICESFTDENVMAIPAVLVHSHGPFCWGRDAKRSVETAVVLEEVAMMAWHTLAMNPDGAIAQELLDKHYLRKHGPNAYYGQK